MPISRLEPRETRESRRVILRDYLMGLTYAQLPTTNGQIHLLNRDVGYSWAECPICGNELSPGTLGLEGSDKAHIIISRVTDGFQGMHYITLSCSHASVSHAAEGMLIYLTGSPCMYLGISTTNYMANIQEGTRVWSESAAIPFKDVNTDDTKFATWAIRNLFRQELRPVRVHGRLNLSAFLATPHDTGDLTQTSSQPVCTTHNVSLTRHVISGHKVEYITLADNAAIITVYHIGNREEKETFVFTPYFYSKWTTVLGTTTTIPSMWEGDRSEYVSESDVMAFIGTSVLNADELSESEMADKAAKEDKGIGHTSAKPTKPTKNELIEGVEAELKKVNRVAWLMRKEKGYVSDKDYTDYLSRHLQIGLELELDFKEGVVIDGEDLRKEFGVSPTPYHTMDGCQICGSSGCYVHIPPNMIRAAEHDGSINGWEFIIYGSTLTSEEFAKRLPLTKLQKYFRITTRDSCHAHALIANQKQPIHTSVLRNVWQLYRFYYPAWAWLVGNTYEHILRPSSYAGFCKFETSGVETGFMSELGSIPRDGGLYFGNMEPTDETYNQELHVEIRTADASLDLEQLIVIRAITKALFVRAAQLANFGTVYVSYGDDKGIWKDIKAITTALNKRGQNR